MPKWITSTKQPNEYVHSSLFAAVWFGLRPIDVPISFRVTLLAPKQFCPTSSVATRKGQGKYIRCNHLYIMNPIIYGTEFLILLGLVKHIWVIFGLDDGL